MRAAPFIVLSRRTALATGLAAIVVLLAAASPGSLSTHGRIAMAVFALAVIGWTLTKLGDAGVALAAAATLVVTGIVSPQQFYATLGNDLVWLLFSAFIIAAVLKASGLAEMLVMSAVGRFRGVPALMHGVTAVVVATALVIPSTSGRAALILPVFLALAGTLENTRITRALALVMPTSILLSAGGSLIGAGAHLVAADFVAKAGHRAFDYLDWLLLGMPMAIVSSHLATEMILRTMLNAEERQQRLEPRSRAPLALKRHHVFQLAVVAATIVMWVSTRLHGIDLAIVALIAAVAITLPFASNVSMKKAAKSVEWDLLIFMAATLLMGKALLNTDADEWLAAGLMLFVGNAGSSNTFFIAFLVATIAVLAHLLITSRTTRVTVLVPAFVLPIAALGYDPVPLILLTVFGTGFCQTMTVSAKPVAIYSAVEVPTYTAQDLLQFSVRFMPVMLFLLMVNWGILWPALGIGSARHTTTAASVQTELKGPAAPLREGFHDVLARCRETASADARARKELPEIKGNYHGRDLRSLARDADDIGHERRLKIVAQLIDGRSPGAVASSWSLRAGTLHEFVCRFNALGPSGLQSFAARR